jgi:hypothetical protein
VWHLDLGEQPICNVSYLDSWRADLGWVNVVEAATLPFCSLLCFLCDLLLFSGAFLFRLVLLLFTELWLIVGHVADD